jgi:hypothetical protein
MPDFEKVISSIRYLDLHPTNITEQGTEGYNWRYLIQKITYLNQAMGMNTRYHFTIYAAGPYSPTLTREYYAQPERIETLDSSYQLRQEDNERLDKIRNCCGILENNLLMEAASTAVFLIREGLTNDDLIIRRIRIIKSHLNYENIIVGLSRAKELLFRPEYLTGALKNESDLLDSIEE